MRPGELGLALLSRCIPICLFAPPLGGLRGGLLVRALCAATLALAVWPLLRTPSDAVNLPLLLLRELLIGGLLGFLAAVPFRAAEAAGALVDWARAGRAGSSSFRNGYFLFTLALFAAFDGPLMVVSAVARSYRVLPLALAAPSPGWPSRAALSALIDGGAQLVMIAASLAAPLLAALLVAELVVALVLRAQPALAEVGGGAVLRTLVATGMLALAAAALAAQLVGLFARLPETLLTALRVL